MIRDLDRLAVPFLALVLGCSPASESGPAHDTVRLGLTGPGARVELLLDAPGPRLGEMFSLSGRVRTEAAQTAAITHVAVDFTMPGHGHGMTTRPRVALGEDGEFRAEGLRLHMFGEWRAEVRVGLADGSRFETLAAFAFFPERSTCCAGD